MRQRLWLVWLALLTVIVVLVLVSRPSKRPAEQPDELSAGRSSSNPSAVKPNAVSSSMPAPGQASPVASMAPALTNTPSKKTGKAAPASAKTKAAAPAPVSMAPDFSDPPPATVMENMRSTLRLFASKFGANPVGTNPEITKALTGDNPKQATFIRPEDGLRINEAGELIDPWGTPFFFHQLSGKEMEIHSAGPDRVMWTDDDLVTK